MNKITPYYTRLAEIMASKRYCVPMDEVEYDDSIPQFLDSRPRPAPLIGMIPMTGKGIEDKVDDLAFIEEVPRLK